MNRIFYFFDIFKAPLNFKINGKKNYSTRLGSLMSFLIWLFIAISFFQSDFFLKEHPHMSSQSIVGSARPYLRFDKSNMTFFIRVTNDNSTADVDPTYFSIIIYNIFVNNTSHNVITVDKKETKVCDEKDFDNPQFFKDYGLTNATCAAENQTFESGGYWTEPLVSYVRLLMAPCKNSSDSEIVCKSQEQIKQYFKNRYFFL